MTQSDKNEVYDRMCHLLTDYEDPQPGQDPVMESDLYWMLVEIQNRWEELTGGENG